MIVSILLEISLMILLAFFAINNLSQNLIYAPFFFLWIIFSYIFGRYSDYENPYSYTFFSESIKTISTTLITFFFIFYLNFNIFKLDNFYYLIIIFSLCSFLIQYLFKISLKLNKLNYLNWLVLCEQKEIKQLKKFLKETKEPFKLNKLDYDKHNLKLIKSRFMGIIVTNDNLFTKENINKLKNFEANGVKIISKVSWCEKILQRIPSELIKESELINKDFLKNSKKFTSRLKRIGDISFSIFLLLITFPILLVCGFLIWYSDKGPVFYSQLRTGYKGIPFRIWKLRSMQVNAEKDITPIWASKNDQRITKIGVFLRKCRIDELPQLINVINGTMSLIGPRPERPEIEETLTREIKNYDIKFQVKPGLSGWAQVNYPYGASISDSKIKVSYDIFYIRNQSTLLDILIFFKTIRMIFNLKGSEPLENNNN